MFVCLYQAANLVLVGWGLVPRRQVANGGQAPTLRTGKLVGCRPQETHPNSTKASDSGAEEGANASDVAGHRRGRQRPDDRARP
jgi:hypothetical protein